MALVSKMFSTSPLWRPLAWISILAFVFTSTFSGCESNVPPDETVAATSNSTVDSDIENLFLGQHYDGLKPKAKLQWQAITSNQPAPPSIKSLSDELVFELAGFYQGKQYIKGKGYSLIILPDHGPLNKAGYPELPKVRVNLIVPPGSQAMVTLIDEEHVDLPVNPPLPSRGPILRNVDPKTIPHLPGAFYQSIKSYPDTLAFADTPFRIRNVQGLPVQFQPFIYDNATGTLRVFTKIRLRVAMTRAGVASSGLQTEGNDFDELYQNMFINYAALRSRYQTIAEPGKMLIITADEFAAALQPFVDWKTQRGLLVEVKKTSEIGSTSSQIRTFIQNQYNLKPALTYVVLVGDSNTVPSLKGNYEGADCDTCYAMVEGDDFYPDLLLSRISGRTLKEIETQVSKFLRYEQKPDLDGDWYTRAIGIASSQGSPKDYERAEELRKSLESYGYTKVAKIYDPSASKTTLVKEINAGASLINYIGHGDGTSWITTGMDVEDVNSLSNGSMLPMIVDVACLNGNFVKLNTCFAESWLRAGTKDTPAGAISMYSASTNASWVPPTLMQNWIVTELMVNEKRYSAGGLYFGGAMKTIDDYPGNKGEGEKLVEQYNVFGDASLMVRTKAPQPLDVQAPTKIPASGTLSVTVKFTDGTLVPDATVALSTTSSQTQLIGSVQTDTQGIAKLSYSKLSGKVRLVVVAFNSVPHIGLLTVESSGTNTAPVADAGANQTHSVGETVKLDGSGSYDADGDTLDYSWTQLNGAIVQLSDPHAQNPTFTMPNLADGEALTFQLEVSDGQLTSDPSQVKVTAKSGPVNHAPIADAGADQQVIEGDQVALDGSGSSDADGDAITYAWTQTGGPKVQLSAEDVPQPTFIAPEVASDTTLTFSLTVNDGAVDSAADEVNIIVGNKSTTTVIEKKSADTPINIPDSSYTGITSKIPVQSSQLVKELAVTVNITHPYIGAVQVVLVCPSGEKKTLHYYSGGSTNNIHKTYAVDTCNGKQAGGTWQLKVNDYDAYNDKGVLDDWSLKITLE